MLRTSYITVESVYTTQGPPVKVLLAVWKIGTFQKCKVFLVKFSCQFSRPLSLPIIVLPITFIVILLIHTLQLWHNGTGMLVCSSVEFVIPTSALFLS